jgi:hypothetical protein
MKTKGIARALKIAVQRFTSGSLTFGKNRTRRMLSHPNRYRSSVPTGRGFGSVTSGDAGETKSTTPCIIPQEQVRTKAPRRPIAQSEKAFLFSSIFIAIRIHTE